MDCCEKDKKIKWKHQTVRRLDRTYEQEQWMRRKLQVVKQREEAERNREMRD